jgi:predicted 3-demethylubiquinone-9 3-methyltransferase (glyoxalase superfamily)
MAKISPFLWFEGNMQEAVNFYMSVFKDARAADTSSAAGSRTASASRGR